jgi:hypothetical protein
MASRFLKCMGYLVSALPATFIYDKNGIKQTSFFG